MDRADDLVFFLSPDTTRDWLEQEQPTLDLAVERDGKLSQCLALTESSNIMCNGADFVISTLLSCGSVFTLD